MSENKSLATFPPSPPAGDWITDPSRPIPTPKDYRPARFSLERIACLFYVENIDVEGEDPVLIAHGEKMDQALRNHGLYPDDVEPNEYPAECLELDREWGRRADVIRYGLMKRMAHTFDELAEAFRRDPDRFREIHDNGNDNFCCRMFWVKICNGLLFPSASPEDLV